MMRKQFITRCSAFSLLSAAVFLWLCAACTQADIVVPEPGGVQTEVKDVPLSVSNLDMSVEVESRSIATGGPEADTKNPNPFRRVGLFVTKEADGSVYQSDNSTQVFDYNAGGKIWVKDSGYAPVLLSADKAVVYAFSPAEQADRVSLSGDPQVPLMAVTVLSRQTFNFDTADAPADVADDVQWQTDQDDYFYGVGTEKPDRWNPAVSLTVSHALAKVSFRILEADGGKLFEGRSVRKIVLRSADKLQEAKVDGDAVLNLKTGELSGTTAVDTLAFVSGGNMRAIGTNIAEADAATVPVQAFGLVIPTVDASVALELTLDDGRLFTISPDADPTLPTTWEKGRNYIYTIRITPQGVEIANVKVTDWTDGGETDVPVAE
jgi:hypothetical protein